MNIFMFYKDTLHDNRGVSDGINEPNDEEVTSDHAVTELKEEKTQNESPISGLGAVQRDVYYAYTSEEGGGHSTVDQSYRPMYSRKFHHPIISEAKESCELIQRNWQNVVHLPHLPFLSRPGWFLRYVLMLHK